MTEVDLSNTIKYTRRGGQSEQQGRGQRRSTTVPVGVELRVTRVELGHEHVDAVEGEAPGRRPMTELGGVDGEHDLRRRIGERQLHLGVEQRRLARAKLGVERATLTNIRRSMTSFTAHVASGTTRLPVE